MRKARIWTLVSAAALAGPTELGGVSKTFSRRTSIVMLSVGLVLASIFTFTVNAANASGNGCNTAPTGASECTQVIGSGLKITSITGHLQIDDVRVLPLANVHIEIFGPHGLIKNCNEYTQTGDIGPNCGYKVPNPTANQAAGYYCTEAWQRIFTLYQPLSTECILVHT